MANYETLKTAIQQVVKTNGNNEIKGALLQQSLLAMINSLGAGYQFIGVVTPATNPGTPDQKVFYVANGKGTYTNFGGISITEDEVVILYYDTAWHKLLTGIASQAKLSELTDRTLYFSVTQGQAISTSIQIPIQKSAGQYVAFELKSDVDISSFAVVYIKPTEGPSVTLKNGLRTNTKYYLQLPEDIVSLAVYAYAGYVKGNGDATFVVYGEIGSVDAKCGQETIKSNIILESLIDKKTIGIVSFQNGAYLDKNGELVADNLGYYSDYIPVVPGDKFKYSGKNLYANPHIYVILDMYKRVLSHNNNTGTFSDLEVEIKDASAAYIRFGSYSVAPTCERIYTESAKSYIDGLISKVNEKIDSIESENVRPKRVYNLFNPSTAIIGKYVKPQDGTLGDSAPNFASDYMEVINGESYSFPVDKSLFGTSLAAQIAMYNASKTFIGAVTGTYAEDNSNILTIVINDANCKYIRTTTVKQTSRYNAKWQTGYDTYMVINSDTYPTRYYPYGEIPQYLDGEFSVENNSLVNPLFGKSVIFDGDSICEANDDTNKLGWAGRIATRNRMMWNNFALGGGTFTKIAGRHVISETDYGNANPDYIIIEGGTNDADIIGSIIGGSIPEQYGSYLPTGYTDEFSTSTYCGAIESLFKRLLSTYPKAKIGVIIAQKMGVSNDYTPTGNNRRAYFETLIKLCEKWGIPYINLWDRGRLNPRLSAYYTADDPGSFYTDGQHLTPNGYYVITPMIEEWMKTL